MSRLAHQLVDAGDGRVRCTACDAVWSRSGTRSACPGITMVRGWDAVPERWKTRTGLRELGLKPGGPRVAVVRTATNNTFDLFEVSAAVDAQGRSLTVEALEARRRRLRSCSACGAEGALVKRQDYALGVLDLVTPFPRLCEPCYDQASRQAHLLPLERFLVGADVDQLGVIDFETTSLDSDASIVEIGLCLFDGTPILSTLVDLEPGAVWGSQEMDITGLTPRAVRGAPRIVEALGLLAEAVADHGITVIGSWSSADARWLHYQLQVERSPALDEGVARQLGELHAVDLQYVYGIIAVEAPFAAPLRTGPGWTAPRASLARACASHGVTQGTAHRALQDAQAAAAVMRRCVARWPAFPRNTASVMGAA